MQYKVPQNIDLEDKIIGPFTMKQFLYLMVAGFIIYGWWQYAQGFEQPSPMAIFIPLALPVGLTAVAFALVKVNDRPFELFVGSFMQFLFIPKKRMWREGYKPEAIITVDKAVEKEIRVVKTSEDLDSLSKTLDLKSQEIMAKEPPVVVKKAATAMSSTGNNTQGSINLSVKDVQSATNKQTQAQTALSANPATQAKSKPGGIMGFFKR